MGVEKKVIHTEKGEMWKTEVEVGEGLKGRYFCYLP